MKKRFDQIDLNSLIYRHQMYMRLFNPHTEKKYLMTEISVLFYYIIKVDSLIELIKSKKSNRNKIIDILEYYLNTFSCSEYNRNLIHIFLKYIKS